MYSSNINAMLRTYNYLSQQSKPGNSHEVYQTHAQVQKCSEYLSSLNDQQDHQSVYNDLQINHDLQCPQYCVQVNSLEHQTVVEDPWINNHQPHPQPQHSHPVDEDPQINHHQQYDQHRKGLQVRSLKHQLVVDYRRISHPQQYAQPQQDFQVYSLEHQQVVDDLQIHYPQQYPQPQHSRQVGDDPQINHPQQYAQPHQDLQVHSLEHQQVVDDLQMHYPQQYPQPQHSHQVGDDPQINHHQQYAQPQHDLQVHSLEHQSVVNCVQIIHHQQYPQPPVVFQDQIIKLQNCHQPQLFLLGPHEGQPATSSMSRSLAESRPVLI